MKPAYLIALFVIGLCMAVTLVTFGSSMTRHVTVAEVKKQPGVAVQVPGDIVKDSVDYDVATGGLRFDIIDRVDKTQRLTIVYPEPKPENFDTANSVEAVGTYRNGVFVADRLLVKCPSKYSDEKPADGAKPVYGDPAKAVKPTTYRQSEPLRSFTKSIPAQPSQAK
jgi:cytochrome c-type biogenesis protein CcmE